MRGGRFATPVSAKQASNTGSGTISQRDCRCGATRVDRQIGLEASPDLYLETMVQVFREVRRVMRPDATAWVNLGDSYSSGGNGPGSGKQLTNVGANMPAKHTEGLASKQLLLMPARLALALQADGWWVRSDIIWHKPNPMPESCSDRPTSAHEHVFLLTRSARYFYDAEAVREEAEYGFRPTRGGNIFDRVGNGTSEPIKTPGVVTHGGDPSTGRNLRNVWTIATHAYSAAYFATFPPELAERCVKAGTSARGCCAQCGAPWRRVVERTPVGDWRTSDRSADLHDGAKGGPGGVMPGWKPATTTGWSPSCTHGGDPVPCTVLDPFAGAGTTLMVADRLQRDAIGIELNPDYTRMAMDRCQDDAPLFADLAAEFPVTDPADERMADLFRDEAAD